MRKIRTPFLFVVPFAGIVAGGTLLFSLLSVSNFFLPLLLLAGGVALAITYVGQRWQQSLADAQTQRAQQQAQIDSLAAANAGLQEELARQTETAEALQRTSERAQTYLEIVETILVAIDADGTIIHTNRKGCRVLGYEADELIGRNWFETCLPSSQRAEVAETFRQLMAGDLEPVEHYENLVVTKEGEQKLIAWHNALLRDGTGRVVGTLSSGQDVTERRKTEEALRHMQKVESLGMLASGVAHDFNNLLVAMLGQTSLALTKLPAGNPAGDHIKKAVAAAERAADLTRQLLAYSGRGQFTVKPVDVNQLLCENLDLFRVAIPANVHLRTDLADALPLIKADASQMQQVVMNLILNGAEAIGEKAGTVTITTSVQEIDESDDRYAFNTGVPLAPGLYVSLEVYDNGQGMDEKTIAKIFDPFFTTKFTGRGLGLAAVLGIIRGHKGGLNVYSEVGQGTTFKVLLPASPATSIPEPVPAPRSRTSRQSGAVLVIDDEEAIRIAVADILQVEGVDVIAAANGPAGIALYRRRQDEIALILLDLSMPGMNGQETFRRLRRINPQARIILSSGYNHVEATQKFTGRGLAAFIQKPYNSTQLVETITQHLG